MIALDTNVLVRYLVDDDRRQAEAARVLLTDLTSERLGFVCREVAVELAWVLERGYGFSRQRIAAVFEELASTKELRLEAADDVLRAADSYRRGGPSFADQMIAAAARRSCADTLYTFDQEVERLPDVVLLPAESS